MGRKIIWIILILVAMVLVLSSCVAPISTASYTVSGYVKNTSGTGISGVTISFSGGYSSVTTNSNGYWSQSGLTGSVVVTPSLSGYTFTPSSVTVTGTNNNVNFVATLSNFSSGGWEHTGYDLQGTYYYPYLINNVGNYFNTLWSNDINSGLILTAPLLNNQMDIISAGSQNVRVFSNNGTLLWTVNPVQDSGISGGYISAMDIGNINGSKVVGVAVSSSGDSEYNDEPTSVLVYSSNGTLIETISTPAAWSINNLKITDLYGNGSFQIVVSISSGYALSPRGIYVYDYSTGSLLWNFQTAGIPYINAIGSFNGNSEKDIVVDTFSPYNGYTVNGMNDWTTYVVLLDPSGNLLWETALQSGNQQTSSSAIVNSGSISEIVTFLSVNIGGAMEIYVINPQNGEIQYQYNEAASANMNTFFKYSISSSGNIYVWNGLGQIQEFNMNLNLLNSINVNGPVNGLVIGSIFSPNNIDILLLNSSGIFVFDENLDQIYSFNLLNEQSLIITDMMNNGVNQIITGGNALTLLSPINQ